MPEYFVPAPPPTMAPMNLSASDWREHTDDRGARSRQLQDVDLAVSLLEGALKSYKDEILGYREATVEYHLSHSAHAKVQMDVYNEQAVVAFRSIELHLASLERTWGAWAPINSNGRVVTHRNHDAVRTMNGCIAGVRSAVSAAGRQLMFIDRSEVLEQSPYAPIGQVSRRIEASVRQAPLASESPTPSYRAEASVRGGSLSPGNLARNRSLPPLPGVRGDEGSDRETLSDIVGGYARSDNRGTPSPEPPQRAQRSTSGVTVGLGQQPRITRDRVPGRGV
jgi:hypothetical protein